MQNLGMVISVFAFLLAGLVLIRGVVGNCLRMFPLFYSYLTYAFCGTLVIYLVYWLDRQAYPSAYWFYYLVSILVEFSVLIEISDHVFRDLPALRQLGRAVTVLVSAGLALFYVLPTIFVPHGRRRALLELTVRASIAKIAVLAILFLLARHYGSEMGTNVGGLMLGFSIYLGVTVSNLAAARAFDPALYGRILWIMTPASYLLCLLVWAVSLWRLAPVPASARDSAAVALELNRFNNQLSKFVDK